MTSNFCQHPLELQMLNQVKRLQLDIRFEIIPDSLPPLDADVSQLRRSYFLAFVITLQRIASSHFGTFSSNAPPVTRIISYGCKLSLLKLHEEFGILNVLFGTPPFMSLGVVPPLGWFFLFFIYLLL
jgi:hypothetical protein